MSIEAMVPVFQESRSAGSTRCVLLALANQASERGEILHYARSQSYLQGMANCSRPTLRKALAELIVLGEIEIVATGDGRRQSSYLIHLPTLCARRKCKQVHDRGGNPSYPLDSDGDLPPGGSTGYPLGETPIAPHHSVLPVDSPLLDPLIPLGNEGMDDISTKALTNSLINNNDSQPGPSEQTFQHVDEDGTDDPFYGYGSAEAYDAAMNGWRGTAVPVAPESTVVKYALSPARREIVDRVLADKPRAQRIRRPDAIERCLRPHGIEIHSQADRRNLAKLCDLAPTIAQLDGACNALRAMEGKLDLGRLIIKWESLKEEAPRPEAWSTPRHKERDGYEAYKAAGGNPYDYPGAPVDYGV